MIPSRLRPSSFKRAFIAGILFCLSHAASALDVIPYFQAWNGNLTTAKQGAGLNSAMLSFAITNGSCALTPTLVEKLPDARNYVASGGRLLISFGGAAGIYAEIACTDDQLFSLIERLMVDSGTRQFDWDVEGHQLLNRDASARRARVLARLQARYPDLFVSLSLPAWLYGFDTTSIDLLNTTMAAGVRIDMIVAMAQSFGAENVRTLVSPPTMGQAVIMTLQNSATQVAKLYPNKSPAQVRAMMGISPMIGINDDRMVFSLDDARTVGAYAKQNGYGLISYWSFQRDRFQASAGATDINLASGVAQSDHQFYDIFKAAAGTSTTAPAPAPAPTSGTTSTSTCTGTAWVAGKAYAAGSIVSYGGKLYIAKFANPGYDPTISTYYWSAYVCATAGATEPAPAPTTVCTYTAWVQGKYYAAGNIVSYTDGKRYIAKFANPGYNPTISTYYWGPSTC